MAANSLEEDTFASGFVSPEVKIASIQHKFALPASNRIAILILYPPAWRMAYACLIMQQLKAEAEENLHAAHLLRLKLKKEGAETAKLDFGATKLQVKDA